MVGEGLTDVALGFDTELRWEMLCVLNRLTEEISGRFLQVHDLANKYAFLTPSNLLDDNYDCQLREVDEDCSDSGIDDEDATKFIYNNGNNSSTDNITAGVAA